MSESGQWLRSSHLARAEGGNEALAAFRDLPAEAQLDVVRFGDLLAEASPSLAEAYALWAPAARGGLAAADFARWASLAVDLGTGSGGNREAAAAFLRLDPARLAGCDPALLTRWLEIVREVHAVSRKLATQFVEGTAADLDGLGGRALETVEAFAAAGLAMAARNGWRGEFLAAAFFAAGSSVLRVLAPEELRRWADLGAAVQVGRELKPGTFRTLPPGFDALVADERSALLSLCERAVGASPRAAAALFESLPAPVAAVDSRSRLALLRALAAGAKDADGVLGLVPLLQASVAALPAGQRESLLLRAAETGARLPYCVVPLLRSLPRAVEQARASGVLPWIERGEAIGASNAEAARAYFALESRTSRRVLRDGSAAAHLEEVHGVLRSYVRMLGGQTLAIRSSDVTSIRAALDPVSIEGASVALPERVDLFDTWEDNFSVLKLEAAGCVGRLLYGTRDLSIAGVCERLPAPLAQVLAQSVTGDGLAGLLEAVPESDPLRALLAASEGARIDLRMRRAYRGYAAEVARIADRFAGRVAQPDRSAELVLYLIGAGLAPEVLATEDLPVGLLEAVAASLGSPAATVDDAIAIAIQIRERIGDSIAVSGFGPPTFYDDLMFEQIVGDATVQGDSDGRVETLAKPGANEIVDVKPESIEEGDEEGPGTPLSADELRRLLEAGAILKIGRSDQVVESAGIFARDLKLPPSAGGKPKAGGETAEEGAARGRRGFAESSGFDYDEWDYQIRDYRFRWCHLDELMLAGDAGEFFQDALTRYAELLPEVRRQFQRLRPERYRKVRGLEDGEDFDWNATVEARVEIRARRSPSQRLYVARRPEERDVATLFLLDMSASTDEPVETPDAAPAERGKTKPRRIIDVTKEAVVIMAEALEELGDRYAIYGFSGQGRDNVEFYLVKNFQEGLNPRVRGRIGGIEPRRSTRMGTALRHARAKMANIASRSKHIFLLSDGFPQDFDYGTDRRSNTYGIQDTMMALQECQAEGITPFCITVDKTGHDYLRQMCETSRYLVLDDVTSLPTELPKIYERWVRA